MKALTLFILASLSVPLSLLAWGAQGHKIVDQIAYSTLPKSVKDSVQSYLGKTKFEDAGNWMDQKRSDHDFDYMKPWHYINIAKGGSYDPNSTNNIVSALDSAISRLHRRNLQSKEQTAIDIKIVMHLVGDLHQPLHVGYATDRGGNTVEVGFFGTTTNLHKVWDSELIEHLHIIADSCRAFGSAQQHIDVIEWIESSRKLLDNVYDFKNATIDEVYAQKNKSVIEMQLSLAGARLSAVLTDLFKS